MSSVSRFFRTHLAPYTGWYVAGTVALSATNAMSVEIPRILARGIDALGTGARDAVVRDALWVAGMGVAVIAVRTASRLLFFTPGRLVEARLKRDLFDRLLAQQPPFLRQWSTGDLVSRTTSDVNNARLLAGFTALGVVNTVVAFAVTGAQMVRTSPTLAAWMILPLVLAFLGTWASARTLLSSTALLQQHAAALSDHALSSFQGAATVKAYGATPWFEDRFREISHRWLNLTRARARLRVAIGPLLSAAASINVFLLLYVGGAQVARGELSVGELVAFTTWTAFLVGPLRGLSFIVSLWKQAEASLDRLEALLGPEPDRPDRRRPGGPLPAPTRPPEIALRGLTVRWGDHPALTDLTLTIPAGTTLGVFGATGAGKSTLLTVLARLENPPAGTVCVDGHDLREIDLDGWRDAVSVVPQRAFLFSESLRDNILLGQPDDGRLAAMIDACCLGPDVAALPNGLDTVVGEAGVTLSGGQRQRATLARGLLRPHVVRLLDDVLSAVDADTEARLIDTLTRTEGARPTTVLVSHRVSALRHADQIAVLEAGRLIDRGTHEELLGRPGPYRETWRHQTDRAESA
jgi:ATP-binding cassette subfamily B multidrug efflux pump